MNRYMTRMYCGLITEKRDAASYLMNLNVIDFKERVLRNQGCEASTK